MNKYTIEEVTDKRQKREFLDLAKRIYKGNRHWVCPLDNDIEARFDPTKNEMFSEGEACRWLARNEQGEVVGRIAAFYNRNYAFHDDQPTGGCGFFESIDSQVVADLLFDTAKHWLQERGMEAMDGPVNFGDRDQWWGLLVEGFELQPLYANNYNPTYYKSLFEKYGFQNYFNQHTYSRNIKVGVFNQSVYDRVKRLEETPGYRIEHISLKDMEQVTDDFRMIYNKAWALFTGVKPIDQAHAHKILKTIRPIIDPKLIYFAYFNDEPVGFFINIPDLNRIIGRFNGKMNWFNKLRLIYLLKVARKADRIFGLIFGVAPEFHGKGIESGMMYAFEKVVARGEIDYKTLELAWIGDFNPVMMRVAESYVCATKYKMHTTYRYLFDRTKEFKRCPRLGAKRTN